MLRQQFHPPKELEPPYSGIAKLWSRDPKSWSWIGWRVWHCYYKDIHYQQFEHGIIMGSFSCLPNSKTVPILFVLTDDSQWTSEQPGTLKEPDCIPPKEE